MAGIIHTTTVDGDGHGGGDEAGVQWSGMECSAVQSSAMEWSGVQCSAVQRSAMQCSPVQCCAVRCSAGQCSAVEVEMLTAIAVAMARQKTRVVE